jgi:hypothetical protein
MTPEVYLQRVRGLLPGLRERAFYTERLRRLPDETFKAFQVPASSERSNPNVTAVMSWIPGRSSRR